jgi:hypothetical protein
VIPRAVRLNPLHAPSHIQMQRRIVEFFLFGGMCAVNLRLTFPFLIPMAALLWSRLDAIEV